MCHAERTKEEPQKIQSNQTLDAINSRTGRNMPQAILTAVLLVALILVCLYLGSDAFMILIVFFMSLGLWELRVDFATAGLSIPIVPLWICSAATMLAMFYSSDHVVWLTVSIFLTFLIVTICASFQSRSSTRLKRAVANKLQITSSTAISDHSRHTAPSDKSKQQNKGLYANVGVSLLTVIYITFLACFIVLPTTFGDHPTAHAIMSVFLPAVGDVSGLAFGAWLGKHKLSPRISPKKSLEGLAGSMIMCIVATFVMFACTYARQDWGRIWWVALLLGAVVGIAGTFGDLSASLIKRDLGIKDMGHLLKGHGGVLDRVDSILMSAPFIALILWVTGL